MAMLPSTAQLPGSCPHLSSCICLTSFFLGQRRPKSVVGEALSSNFLGFFLCSRCLRHYSPCQTLSPIFSSLPPLSIGRVLMLCLLSVPQGRALAHHLNCKSNDLMHFAEFRDHFFFFIAHSLPRNRVRKQIFFSKAYSHLIKEDTKRHQAKQKGSSFQTLTN